MKFLILALVAVFLANPALAQDEYVNSDNQIVVHDESDLQVEAKNYYYNFGGVPVGRHAIARFTLSNNGRFPFYIDSINIEGAGFERKDNCPKLLFSGQSCRIVVRFTPYFFGQHMGALKINLTGSQ